MDVYGIFGHGCDVIRATNAETDTEMPPDCTYVTIVLCGLYSHYLVKLMYAFQDPFIKDALKNPIENIEKLNAYFTLYHQDMITEPIIHVHKAGTAANTYVDSVNTFLYDASPHIFKSGLYRLGSFNTLDAFHEDDGMRFMDSIVVDGTGPITREHIDKLYRGSLIQPELPEVAFPSLEAFNRVNEHNLTRYLSDLFATRPGIYYNFACRPSCTAEFQSKTERRRERSRHNQYRADYYVRLGHNMQPILPDPDVIRSIDPALTQTVQDWYNVRARITNEFIRLRDLSKGRAARRSAALRNLRGERATRNLKRRGLSKTKKSRMAPKSQRSRILARAR